MYDLENNFLRLTEKYGVIFDSTNIQDEIFMYNQYKNELLEVLSTIKDEAIGLYGLGENASRALDIIGWENDYNIVCLIDNDTAKKELFIRDFGKLDVPIITSEHIGEYNPSKIIILHLNSRKAIKEHVTELYPNIECFDIYENLEKKGIKYATAFHDSFHYVKRKALQLHSVVLEYKTCGDLQTKESLLSVIISEHLKIRDFYNAELFIRDYVFLGFDVKRQYRMFWKELKELFSEIKEITSKKSKDNFIFFVGDALYAKDIENMDFVNDISSRMGAVFKNAYSNSSCTYSSYKSFFSGKESIFDKNYKYSLTPEEYEKLNVLLKKGYKLNIYGATTKYKSIAAIGENSEQFVDIEGTKQNPCCYFYWQMLCSYVKNDEKTIYFVHTKPEVHEPFYNNIYRNELRELYPKYLLYDEFNFNIMKPLKKEELDELDRNFEEILIDGAEYIDRQLEFYFKFINFNNDTVFVMGDHGERDRYPWRRLGPNKFESIESYYTKAIHPAFVVINKNLSPSVQAYMFNYLDIFDMVNDFSCSKYDVTKYKSDIVRAFEYPTYNRNAIIVSKFFDEPIHGLCLIITEKDKYIYFLNGKEVYHVLPDEETNLVNDERYAERVNYFRKMVEGIDINEICRQKKFTDFKELILENALTDDLCEREMKALKRGGFNKLKDLEETCPNKYKRGVF